MSTKRPITLITGASSGLGAALAHEFARHGHELMLVARHGGELAAVADAIAAAGKARPHVAEHDLTQRGAGDAIEADLAALGAEPQFIVNNAGFGLAGAASELSRAEQAAMIDLNVRALTEFSLRWAGSAERHRGGILNVASIAGFLPGPHMAVYHATKAYVLSFSEALRQELGETGVRVAALCPGPVATGFQDRAGIDIRDFPKPLMVSAERVAREAYAGFMAGRAIITPGIGNRVLTFLPRLLPRAVVVWLMGRGSAERARGSTVR